MLYKLLGLPTCAHGRYVHYGICIAKKVIILKLLNKIVPTIDIQSMSSRTPYQFCDGNHFFVDIRHFFVHNITKVSIFGGYNYSLKIMITYAFSSDTTFSKFYGVKWEMGLPVTSHTFNMCMKNMNLKQQCYKHDKSWSIDKLLSADGSTTRYSGSPNLSIVCPWSLSREFILTFRNHGNISPFCFSLSSEMEGNDHWGQDEVIQTETWIKVNTINVIGEELRRRLSRRQCVNLWNKT